MLLKPQDILVALKLATLNGSWSFPSLSSSLGISLGESHKSVQRLIAARLYNPATRTSIRAALEEFLLHGVKYCFPVERGGMTFGIPTAWAAAPLKDELVAVEDIPPVWPHPEGSVSGYELAPLYPTVPQIALEDPKMYRMLALLDGIRGGGARERNLAGELLHVELLEAFGQKEIQPASRQAVLV